jgi:hypothetical protein
MRNLLLAAVCLCSLATSASAKGGIPTDKVRVKELSINLGDGLTPRQRAVQYLRQQGHIRTADDVTSLKLTIVHETGRVARITGIKARVKVPGASEAAPSSSSRVSEFPQ